MPWGTHQQHREQTQRQRFKKSTDVPLEYTEKGRGKNKGIVTHDTQSAK